MKICKGVPTLCGVDVKIESLSAVLAPSPVVHKTIGCPGDAELEYVSRAPVTASVATPRSPL